MTHSKLSLVHAQALKEIILPLNVDKLERYDKMLQKNWEKQNLKVSKYRWRKVKKQFFISEILSCNTSAKLRKASWDSKGQ